MEVYRSEEEQVEALKKWWDENGRSLIIGIALALLGVLGWRTWNDHIRVQGEQASALYEQMLARAESGNDREVQTLGQQILAEYPKSAYGIFASLTLAQQAVKNGDQAAAAAHLRWVMNSDAEQEIKLLARLRLARVTLSQGDAAAALSLLDEVQAGAFSATYDEVRGDAYLKQNERKKAFDAYTNALAGYAEAPSKQALVRMKLDDLAGVKD